MPQKQQRDAARFREQLKNTIMEKYNYLESVKEDVKNWLEYDGSEFKGDHADENGNWLREDNRDEIQEDLYDMLWTNDSVTGNGSGSYWFSSWKAEEAICHNMDLVEEAFNEFDLGAEELGRGAEYIDVTIRCYLLSQAINEVLDEYLERASEEA